ncbi:MAG: nucleoside-diphosphate kinase [Patescibacteria group bacterium]|nr:nucleoside-diphosphate kinase [Patescibacteria group bacterium]
MKQQTSAVEQLIKERCVTILKPGVSKPDIVCYFINFEFRPNGSPNGLFQKFIFTEGLLREFYPHIVNKPYWPEFLDFMTSEECLIGIFQGFGVVKSVLEFVGEKTDPQKNPPHTIRGKFGINVQSNAVHCSRTPEDAERELQVLRKHGIIV